MAAIIVPAAIGAAVGAELPKFFDDALDQFGSGEGVYLRDGDPRGIVAKVGQAVGRAYCRSYDSVSAEYPPGRGERIEAACRPYLDSIGSPGGPGLRVPFPGGQCPERYLLTVTVTAPQGISGSGACVGSQSVTQGAGPYWGPILSIDRGPDLCDSGPGIAAMYTITAFSDPGGQRSQTPVTSALALEAYDVVVVSTERVDGMPDDCGDPPPVPVTPTPVPNPQPPPFRFNPSPDIDINIDVNLNPDGTFNFNIGTGPISVDPFAPGGGDGGGGGGAGGGDGLPGEPDAVGPPASSGEPGAEGEDVDFGPPPPGKVWVGCLFRFEAPSAYGDIPGTAGRNRVWTRVIGNASLRYGSQRGTAAQVRSEWFEAFRPVTALQVTGAFVNALPGVSVTTFPVSATICPEDTCGGDDG